MAETTKAPAQNIKEQKLGVIAEFKKGKIVFKQKPLPLESLSETMQEIVRFRDFVHTQDSPLSAVPHDYLPLIAKLVQESDKSLTALTKSILSLLFPTNSSSPALSDSSILTKAVEEAIKNVAERVNYGIISGQDSLPASCFVWRWEVKNYKWLPKSVQESALARLAERKQAQEFLQSCFDQLSKEDKSTILTKKSIQQVSASTGHEKSDRKSLKATKEKREAESMKKSAAAFANFFLKTRPTLQSDESGASASASTQTLSDFQGTFRPFLVKKGVRMFTNNWFIANQSNKDHDTINVDNEMVEVWQNAGKGLNGKEVLGPLSSYFPPDIPSLYPIGQTLVARRQFRKRLRCPVRSVINQLNEAELQGDHKGVQKLLTTLKDRRKIPVKVFYFFDFNRPGYLGTWTKISSKINPRRPFARDLQAFDYDHDSDAEWEVDENGEDVDSGDDSMEEDTSSTASDLDDWLIDDDDVTEDHPDSSTLTLNKKRKPAETSGVKSHNKKRRVVPLVPFQKGPIWEKHLGACEDDLFNQMRIQMFNDIPEPLNPFQYISISEAAKSGSEDDSQAANSTSEAFTSVALSNSPSNNLRVMDGCRTLKNKQNATSIPKTTFPDIHIETLLRKITTVNTNSFAVLVDTLYQDLKPMGIKKNALEVKLREVAEKDKEMKSWKVKETTWTQYKLDRLMHAQ